MLLAPTEGKGDVGKKVFFDRMRRYLRGGWLALLQEAIAADKQRRGVKNDLDGEALRQQLAQQAAAKIRLREVSRAQLHLASAGLAPGTDTTLRELTDPVLRPQELTEPIPERVLEARPAEPLKLDPDQLLSALRSAGRGSAQDLAGTRYEHLRVLIEDEELWGLFERKCLPRSPQVCGLAG